MIKIELGKGQPGLWGRHWCYKHFGKMIDPNTKKKIWWHQYTPNSIYNNIYFANELDAENFKKEFVRDYYSMFVDITSKNDTETISLLDQLCEWCYINIDNINNIGKYSQPSVFDDLMKHQNMQLWTYHTFEPDKVNFYFKNKQDAVLFKIACL